MPADPVESFWDFSVRTYRTAGVPDACLLLQDECGVDVNMLLYCCWLAIRRGEFDDELWSDVIDFSTAWASKLVKPLRFARTWMKLEGCGNAAVQTDACMRLREKVKSVEFDAEKMQQDVLESLTKVFEHNVSSGESLLTTVVKNVIRYCRHLELQIDGEVAKTFSVIVAAAFSDIEKPQILNAFAAYEVR